MALLMILSACKVGDLAMRKGLDDYSIVAGDGGGGASIIGTVKFFKGTK